MLEYAEVPRIVCRKIYRNKIVWLQDFHAIPLQENLDNVQNRVKAVLRDLLISAPSVYIFRNKFSIVYIIERTLRVHNVL